VIRIRPAADGDWSDVWPFLWPVLAVGTVFTYPQDMSEVDARAAWLPPPPWHVVVAELTEVPEGLGERLRVGRVVGLAKFGPNQPGRGSHVANASFVVDPVVSGSGVGRALAEATLEQCRELGFRAMQFNAVVATNTSATELWRSLGFNLLATVPEAFDHPTEGLVGLHVMHRFL
jgi:GNAT superfamily N-acetyltransferase